MPKGNYTVLYEKDGTIYKICRVLFGSDGSYYVTSPYHAAQKLFLFKATLNYASKKTCIPFNELVDAALANDDDMRIKLSHHPEGFVQFSGQGILSGKDPDGKIRGIGMMSWPLFNPTLGPAFGLVIRGVERFERAGNMSEEACLFRHDELATIPRANILNLEGYHFPPLWRRFIQTAEDHTKTISITHPSKAVLRLKVLMPPERCDSPGFIGLEMYNMFAQEDQTDFFSLSGPSGNLRRHEKGELLADGIFCMYPRPDQEARSLDFSMYYMPSITDDPGGRGDKTES